MVLDNKGKFYILIILVLVTFLMIRYGYHKQHTGNISLENEISKNNQMILKIKEKRAALNSIKNSLKISSDKLKELQLGIFNGKDASDTIDAFQKYIFEYFTNKGIDVSDYRQFPIKDKGLYYICGLEINFKTNTETLLQVFQYINKSNFVISVQDFNISFADPKSDTPLRVRLVMSSIYLKKIEEVK